MNELNQARHIYIVSLVAKESKIHKNQNLWVSRLQHHHHHHWHRHHYQQQITLWYNVQYYVR